MTLCATPFSTLTNISNSLIKLLSFFTYAKSAIYFKGMSNGVECHLLNSYKNSNTGPQKAMHTYVGNRD